MIEGMAGADGDGSRSFVWIGHMEDLGRFLAEYGLRHEDVKNLVAERTPPGAGGMPGRPEYLVHHSLLRSHGEFACAGDVEALSFCRQIAQEMVAMFGVSPQDAKARVNRQWSQPARNGRAPRVWIVGLDIAYHQTPQYWARHIYSEQASG
jgi:hypothetical protein